MKDLGETELHGRTENIFFGGGEKIFCSKSLKININSTILRKNFSPAAHNCFQIIQIHSFSKKYHKLSQTDTILIFIINTCLFSLPHDIVLSLCFWWGKSDFKKFRNSGG